MKNVFLLGMLLCCASGQAQPGGDVQDLIRRLGTSPVAADIDKAAELIARGTAGGAETDLETLLHTLIKAPGTHSMVLAALANWPVPELELELIESLPKATDAPPADLDAILAAIGRSGGGAARNSLRGLVDTQQGALFANPITRRKLWQALFNLDPSGGLYSALRFTRYFGPLDQPAADFLVSLIQQVRTDRDLLPRCFPAFYIFLGFPSRVFPPPPNPVLPSFGQGSPPYKVQKAIADTLVSMGSPLALDLLVAYSDSDAADLSAAGQSTDYGILQQESWLLPSGSVILTPFGTVPGKAGKTLLNYKIGVPRELPFIPESKFQQLYKYEQAAKAAGAALPDAARARTTVQLYAGQNAMISSVVKRLATAYDWNITPNLPADPGNAPPEIVDPGGQAVRYGSFMPVHMLAGSAVAKAVEPFAPAEPVRSQTISYVMTKEWERRALVLYSVLAAYRKLGLDGAAFDPASGDDELDRLASLPSPAGVVATTPVSEIAAGPNPVFPSPCVKAAIALKARIISLSQAMYSETLGVTCDGAAEHLVEWIGAIPEPLIAAFVRHPRILDFPNVSLAVRELKGEVRNGPPVLEDIDYVRAWPVIAIPYLAAAIGHPTIPWRHIKDTLIFEIYQQTDLWNPSQVFRLTPAKPPVVEPAGPSSLANQLPASTVLAAADYDAMKSKLTQPLTSFITAKAGLSVVQQVRGIVDQRVDSQTWKCNSFCYPPSMGGGCGTSCGYGPNPVKSALLSQIDAEVAKQTAAQAPLQQWDLSGIGADSIQQVVTVRNYVAADFARALMLYEIDLRNGQQRYVALESTLNGFPRWASALITRDPTILGRYGIDLGDSTAGASSLTADSLARELRDDALAVSITGMLNRTGLLPLVHFGSHFNVNRGPLLRTAEGRARVAELTVYDRVTAFATGAAMADRGAPRPDFGTRIAAMQQQIDQSIGPQVKSKTDSTWNDINQRISQGSGGFTFGISLTFGAPLPILGFNFSIGPIGLNLSSSFANDLLVTGSWNNHGLPFRFDVPLASAPDNVESPAVADVALASKPAELAAGGLTFAPSRAPAAIAGPVSPTPAGPANAVAPAAPPDGPTNTVTWTLVPVWGPLPTFGPATPDTQDINVQWFRGLLGRAAPKLTPEEWAAVNQAIQSGSIPPAIQDVLYRRGNQALEEQNIANRIWMRTSHVDQLIPQDASGQITPVPTAPNLTGDEAIQKWIDIRNDQYRRVFSGDLAEARKRIGLNKVMVDGMPAVKITYGNDYRVMRFEYEYLLTEGGSLSRAELERTPFWIVDQVRQNPDGHIYEMYFTAVVASMLSTRPDFQMINAGELRKLQESNQFIPVVTKILEGLNQSIADLLKPSIQKFLDTYRDWAQQNSALPVDNPYDPPPDAIPMLNLFPSPFEWYQRREEPIQDILIYQRSSAFGSSVASGTTVISGPDPGIP